MSSEAESQNGKGHVKLKSTGTLTPAERPAQISHNIEAKSITQGDIHANQKGNKQRGM